MKRIIIIVCALLFILNGKAQTIYFNNLYDYNNELQFGFDVFQLNDTGYTALSAPLNPLTANRSALVSFYDSIGNRKSYKAYGDSGYQYYIGEPNSFKKTYDGGYVFGGTIVRNSDNYDQAMLMKLTVHGDTEFVKTFGDTSSIQAFYACIQAYDSGYTLIGVQEQEWHYQNYQNYIYVVRTDKHGKTVWQKSYNGTHNTEYGWSVAQLSNHHLVFSGTMDSSNIHHPLILETDSLGNLIKQKMYQGSAMYQGGRMQSVFNNGFVFLSWIDTLINAGDYPTASLITFLDSNYNIESRIIYNQPEPNDIYTIRQLADSSFIFVGFVQGVDSSNTVGWIAKISKDGAKEWQHYYIYSNFVNYFADVEQTEDKGFIITGAAFANPHATQDLWLVKLDSNGCLQPGCLLNVGTAEIDINPDNENLEIYPNPNNGDFTVDLPNTDLSSPEIFTVYNLTGQQIFSKKLTERQNEIYLANQLAGGVYICRIEMGDNNVVEKKLVVIK